MTMRAVNELHQSVYFIGIALPSSVRRQVADLRWHLYQKDPGLLRPVLPHITLLHPLSLDGILPSQLLPQIRTIAKRYLPMTIELNRVDFFGQEVCYLAADSFKLYSLRHHLVRLLPPDVRKTHYRRHYLPHVTLAQIYNPAVLDKKELSNEIHGSLKLPIRFTVTSVASFTRILPRAYRANAIK